MTVQTATPELLSEEVPATQFAIPFVVTPDGALCDAGLVRRSLVRDFISRSFFKCACCGEDVVTRCGFTKPLYFAHFPATDDTTPCAWRVAHRGQGCFDERNPDGDDGAWHIQAQLQIMSVLERSGIPSTRNTYLSDANGVRIPDISCEIASQRVHFEIQSSPTNAPSASQRTERDFKSFVSTVWVVNCARYVRHMDQGSLPCWVDNIASFGGGQIWLWDDECYQRSLKENSLWVKRATIDAPADVRLLSFLEGMPYVLPIEAKISSSGSVSVAFPPGFAFANDSAITSAIVTLIAEMRSQLSNRRLKFGHTYRIDYPIVRLNTAVLDFMFSENSAHKEMRTVFNNRWRKI